MLEAVLALAGVAALEAALIAWLAVKLSAARAAEAAFYREQLADALDRVTHPDPETRAKSRLLRAKTDRAVARMNGSPEAPQEPSLTWKDLPQFRGYDEALVVGDMMRFVRYDGQNRAQEMPVAVVRQMLLEATRHRRNMREAERP